MSDEHGFSTRAIHAGQEADAATGAVVPPIYQVVDLQAGRHRRPARRLRVQPLGQPDPHRARGVLRRARGRRAAASRSPPASPARTPSPRALLVPGDHVVVPNDAYGGTYRYFNKVAKPQGVEHSIATIADVDAVRAAIRPGHDEDGLGRDADQPAARHRRHRGHRRGRPRGRRPARRRQHLRDALPPEPARARRRHRDALDDEVRRRPQRRRRRRRRDAPDHHACPASRTPRSGSPSTRTHRRRGRPVRLVADAARPQDARDPHGAALRQRREGRRVPRGPRRRLAGALPGPARPRRTTTSPRAR